MLVGVVVCWCSLFVVCCRCSLFVALGYVVVGAWYVLLFAVRRCGSSCGVAVWCWCLLLGVVVVVGWCSLLLFVGCCCCVLFVGNVCCLSFVFAVCGLLLLVFVVVVRW